MTKLEIFTKAIGLVSPWEISDFSFQEGENGEELHLDVSYKKGEKFEYENAEHSVYDHQERRWRHLNFLEHPCYIHARVPRVKLPSGYVRLVQVPWADKGSSYTLSFERHVAALVDKGISVVDAAAQLNLSTRSAQRILKRL